MTSETPTPGPWWRRLHWQIAVAMVLGIGAGLLWGESAARWFGWLGDLFVRLLRMVIVPLVFTSIVSGIASMSGGQGLGRLFAKTLSYFVASSLMAILIGLVLVNLIRPGVGANLTTATQATLPELDTPSSPAQLLLDMVPTNVVAAASKGDMLGLIVFCILFGAALAAMPGERTSGVVSFFTVAFEAMMRLTGWIIAVAPLGVFGLISRMVGTTGLSSFKALGLYMGTVTVGLLVHLFVVLPLLLIVLGRINPRIHFRNMIEPLVMAFSTSSSGATLPVTIRAVEKKVGVSNRVSSFVLPMGATVNMDGTALYECAGVLFISQVLGIELSFWQQAIVVFTSLLASIGAAAVPSAGLVIIFLVLESVNLRGPEVDALVGMMLAVDRPLDMLRTSVNVFSDSVGAAVIARSEGESNVDTEVVP